MNHTPQFSIGEEVISAKHGAGVIKWIYPYERRMQRNLYSVEIAGLRKPLVLDGKDLRARVTEDPPTLVRCIDCLNNTRPLVRSSILCPAINQYRKVVQLRPCKRFVPRPAPVTQGA